MPRTEWNVLTFQSVKAAELRVFDQVMPQVQFAPSITHIVQGREKMCENNGPGYLVNTILRVAGVQGARRSPDSSLRVRGRGYITPNFGLKLPISNLTDLPLLVVVSFDNLNLTGERTRIAGRVANDRVTWRDKDVLNSYSGAISFHVLPKFLIISQCVCEPMARISLDTHYQRLSPSKGFR